MEYGTVIDVAGGTILVEVESCSSCEGCAAGSGCAIAGDSAKRRIRMENSMGARVGDRVGFVIEARAVVAGSLLFYLLPVVMLVGGAIGGSVLGGGHGTDGELYPLLGGCAGLIMSFPVIAAVSRALKGRRGFVPRLEEVEGRDRELI